MRSFLFFSFSFNRFSNFTFKRHWIYMFYSLWSSIWDEYKLQKRNQIQTLTAITKTNIFNEKIWNFYLSLLVKFDNLHPNMLESFAAHSKFHFIFDSSQTFEMIRWLLQSIWLGDSSISKDKFIDRVNRLKMFSKINRWIWRLSFKALHFE